MDPKNLTVCWIVLLMLASTAFLTAQAPEQRLPFQVSVANVDVDVTVTDAQGEFAANSFVRVVIIMAPFRDATRTTTSG